MLDHHESCTLGKDKYCLTDKTTRLHYKDQSVNAVREIIALFIAKVQAKHQVPCMG
jgi:hypothetical protein